MDKEQFLLQEHRELWAIVRKVTDERNGWLKFYWTIITASLAATGFLHGHLIPTYPSAFWKTASIIFLALTVVSIVISITIFGLRVKSVGYKNCLHLGGCAYL